MTCTVSAALRERLTAVCASPYLLLCSDYDGTLAPIAASPDAARLGAESATLLTALAHATNVRVAIISGRPLHDLQRHSRLEPPVFLVGSHGAESSLHAAAALTETQLSGLTRLRDHVAELCAAVTGSWVEDKPLGVAVHVRQADPQAAAGLLSALEHGPARWPGVYATPGKAVMDLSISACNKGHAIEQLRSGWGTDPTVLYLGDDVTDEAAFRVLGPTDVGVKVGAGDSCASYRVMSDAEIPALLAFVHACRVNGSVESRG
jgi:trehalose 6-phosphate phosphatase